MGGIAGFIEKRAETRREALETVVRRMAEALRHRGPDESGTWVDEGAGVAIGHRSLTVTAHPAATHQPVVSRNGRWTLAYDGEVYNTGELRRTLRAEGYPFRSDCAAEVVLAAVESWGIERTARKLVGMFALVLWDSAERRLSLLRDRIGIKPIYYGWGEGIFLFGSELKALREHPGWKGRVDRGVVSMMIRYGYIPSPYSIYENIYKLCGGTILQLDWDDLTSDKSNGFSPFPQKNNPEGKACPIPYWTVLDSLVTAGRDPFTGSEDEAVEELEALLKYEVFGPMVRDIAPATFLSGGIDSSTVLAMLGAVSERPVKTFTVGFHSEVFDESGDARRIAEHLGADHHELYVTAEQFVEVIPTLPTLYDEPFCSPSSIPTYLVSKLARESTKVCFTGDGGDHFFGGANRYIHGSRLWRRIGRVPYGFRRTAALILNALPISYWGTIFSLMGPLLPRMVRSRSAEDTIYKLSDLLCVKSLEEWYERMNIIFREWRELMPETPEIQIPANGIYDHPGLDNMSLLMCRDITGPLSDRIMVKVDRASMAAGLETRVPFLDHRVIEFAARLPLSMKIRHGTGKRIVRKLLCRYVPETLFEKPKTGFELPMSAWLSGPLRDWAEALLDESRLRQEGFFEPGILRRKWHEHLSRRRDWYAQLWSVLVFQGWLENQGDPHRLD
ncbi:asparagine synthase (glutamine-hydrolyzing) [Thermodesulfobacteriota bacterium]